MDLLNFIVRRVLSTQHSPLRPGDDADVDLRDEELGVAGGAWHDFEYLQTLFVVFIYLTVLSLYVSFSF